MILMKDSDIIEQHKDPDITGEWWKENKKYID